MTKIHKTKLVLLSATAFFAASTARAQVADSWAITGDVTVTAANTADTTTVDPVNPGAVAGIDTALISAGFRNSISGSAVGSSASSSFTSVNNSGVGGAAALTVDGTISVGAGNGSAVLNNTDVIGSAIIADGSANSISLAAVGSSASVSGSATLSDVGGAATAGETYAFSANSLAVSSGSADGDVEVDQGSLTGGNDNTVSLILATGFNAPAVTQGFGNSISVAGVGSSASASFSATVGGDGSSLDSFDLTLTDGAAISSTNSDNGTVAVGLTDAGIVTPQVNGGNGNSISAAALGSSASFSLNSSTYGGGVIGEFNATVGELTVDSTNGGNLVTLSSDGAAGTPTLISEAAIAGAGNGNSISASAVGSSASVSYSNNVYDTGAGTAAGAVSFQAITVNSTNNGTIGNTVDLGTSGSIDGGSRNSISIAGVGASASQTFSVTDYSGAGLTGVASTAEGGITLTAFNTGVVGVSGGLSNPSIADGFSNSISAAAVGASASQSVTRTLVGAQ
ncbi:hypothetical protein [Novosphingobium sp.]|uniref:beta strand repeat-containing protein n=1 Tax=Novosphingobium sp. TaxID=1874826 RepID=UPI002610C746|nr:hypothetical protein [Novosphingobium sp.]